MKLNTKKIVLFFSITNISLDIYSSNDEGKAPKAPKGFIILEPKSCNDIEGINIPEINFSEIVKILKTNKIKNNNFSLLLNTLEKSKKI